MAIKITGYEVRVSTGGNTCVQCNTRMRKGLPYLTPIQGKRVVKEVKGRSICISCIDALTEKVTENLTGKEKDVLKYEQRRFLTHFDD